MSRILDALVAATGLKGVNGLDFIVENDSLWVLEINPRPTATIDLYDADLPAGVIGMHLQACRGELMDLPQFIRARAHGIVYAPAPLHVPAQLRWPAWCTDLPEAGSIVPKGSPVCSVHAETPTPSQASQLVRDRHEQLQGVLWRDRAAA
jgi:predicted ATP-grasp superfamily ATP-dependent carboligase